MVVDIQLVGCATTCSLNSTVLATTFSSPLSLWQAWRQGLLHAVVAVAVANHNAVNAQPLPLQPNRLFDNLGWRVIMSVCIYVLRVYLCVCLCMCDA